MCDKAKWSFPVLRSGVVLRTRERAPSCTVVCGPEEDSWTRSLTVSLLNGPLFPLAKWSRRAADQRSRGRAECGRGRVPTGGVNRALSEGTFRRPKRDRRSLQGCRTRTAGQSGGRPAARGSPGRPRGPGRRASAGGPSEASQSRRLWRRQRGRALPTLSADDNSVNSTSVETHLQLKTTPRSARRTRGGPRRAASQKPGRARAFSNFTSRPEGQRAGTAEASMWQERAAPVWGTPASPPRGSHCLPGRDRKSQGACAAASGLEGLDH